MARAARQVNILEAKNRLSELVRAVQSGEEIVIANRGAPVARLVPVEPGGQASAPIGSAERILDWIARHPLPDRIRRTRKEIDAGIRAERDAWD